MFAQDFSLEKLLVRRAIARGDQGLDLVSIFADNLPHGVWRLVGRSQTCNNVIFQQHHVNTKILAGGEHLKFKIQFDMDTEIHIS